MYIQFQNTNATHDGAKKLKSVCSYCRVKLRELPPRECATKTQNVIVEQLSPTARERLGVRASDGLLFCFELEPDGLASWQCEPCGKQLGTAVLQ